jgi:hypothetical protein
MPVVTIENVGPDTADAPFTFGQVFAPGHLRADAGLVGVVSHGNVVPLQVDIKAKHPDGSVRHAILSGVLPKAAAGEKVPLILGAAPPMANKLAPSNAGPAVPEVLLNIDGVQYRATIDPKGTPLQRWLSGPVVQESRAQVPFVGPAGPHPHLTALFAFRSYGEKVRLEVVIENTRTFAGPARNYTYHVAITAGGKTLYATSPDGPPITHYRQARWRWVSWLGAASDLVVHPDTAYLIATRAIPNYDLSVKPSEKMLAEWGRGVNAGPMKIGPIREYMPTTGGRPDIGPLPGFTVAYLLSHDRRAHDAMLAAADGAGSWPIHYRDENTGYPLRTDTTALSQVTTHGNMAHKGPLPVPRTIKGQDQVPYTPDTAHQPSLAYLPYLITGEQFYLDELHFWAAWNPLETAPGNHGNGAGLVRWQQLRGQAWSVRTLGHTAYITPDDHPMKAYFSRQLGNNLDFYLRTYVEGKPNALGIYDGSGEGAFQLGGTPPGTGAAPWQDDYFTWAIGHLVELGSEKAKALFNWKAQFVVGRLTAPGFDPIMAADYFYRVRDDAGGPVYDTFAQMYQKNYSGDVIADDDRKPMSVPGKRWIDQKTPAAQAAWIREAGRKWTDGQTFGYAGSTMGYPSNMQPALATAVTLGVPGAEKAWQVFESRTVKPVYADGPQFAIVPRPKAVVVEQPKPPAKDERIGARVRLEQAVNAYASAADKSVMEKAALDATLALTDVLVAERAARGGK